MLDIPYQLTQNIVLTHWTADMETAVRYGVDEIKEMLEIQQQCFKTLVAEYQKHHRFES